RASPRRCSRARALRRTSFGPCALDPALAEQHRRAAGELGLDEGATPIFTPFDRPPVEGESAGPGLRGIVFTNVEEHMRLAWLGRPAPLCCLLRIEGDARGEELARALDQDPLAEDLSAETSLAGDEDAFERTTAQGGPVPRPMRPTPRASDDDAEPTETES
ncbi:MAG: hypothetical protein IPJ77_15260, partial [Planctomycetes bacterium]|nr:hypothetical protein [Planctomycetota bacterium]